MGLPGPEGPGGKEGAKHRGDEGTEGKPRTKQKLTPATPPPWGVGDIPQALLAALKDKETANL